MDLQQTLAEMTPDQFSEYQTIQHQLLILHITTIGATVIILWEHVVLFDAELRTWRALLRGKVMPARLAVVLVRYLVVAAIGVTLAFLFGNPPSCKASIITIYGLYTGLVAVASSIFLMRLHIIFAGHHCILMGYYILYLCHVGAWIAVDFGFDAYEVPPQLRYKYGGRCAPRAAPWWASIGWSGNLLFDAATLIGTWIKLRSLQRRKDSKRALSNRTHRFIWLSNIFYFSVSCCFNLGCLVTELTVKSPIYSHLPSPIAFCAHTIISSRLLLTAKGWGTLDPEEDLEQEQPDGNTVHMSRRGGRGRSRKAMPQVSFTVDEVVTIHDAPATEIAVHGLKGVGTQADRDHEKVSSLSTGDCSKLESFNSMKTSLSQGSRQIVDTEPARIVNRSVSPVQAWTPGPSARPPANAYGRRPSADDRETSVSEQSHSPPSKAVMAAYPRLSGIIPRGQAEFGTSSPASTSSPPLKGKGLPPPRSALSSDTALQALPGSPGVLDDRVSPPFGQHDHDFGPSSGELGLEIGKQSSQPRGPGSTVHAALSSQSLRHQYEADAHQPGLLAVASAAATTSASDAANETEASLSAPIRASVQLRRTSTFGERKEASSAPADRSRSDVGHGDSSRHACQESIALCAPDAATIAWNASSTGATAARVAAHTFGGARPGHYSPTFRDSRDGYAVRERLGSAGPSPVDSSQRLASLGEHETLAPWDHRPDDFDRGSDTHSIVESIIMSASTHSPYRPSHYHDSSSSSMSAMGHEQANKLRPGQSLLDMLAADELAKGEDGRAEAEWTLQQQKDVGRSRTMSGATPPR